MSDVCSCLCCRFVDIWLQYMAFLHVLTNTFFSFPFEGEGAVEIQTDIWFRRRITWWKRRCRAVPSARVLGKPLKKQTDFLLVAPLLPDGSSYPDCQWLCLWSRSLSPLLDVQMSAERRPLNKLVWFLIPVLTFFSPHPPFFFLVVVVFCPFCMKL